MTIAVLASLVLACLYLLKRAHEAGIENTLLRQQVATLKRLLARRK
jgi:hypothetical protein